MNKSIFKKAKKLKLSELDRIKLCKLEAQYYNIFNDLYNNMISTIEKDIALMQIKDRLIDLEVK